MHWWPIFVTMQGLCICIIICDIICEMQFSGFVQLGRWRCCYVLLCLFVRVPSEDHRSKCAHHSIALCVQVLCVVGVCVDRSTSFAFRCLCRLKSTSPSSLSFPESVQKSMCYEIKKLPSGLSFQIYILLVFKYIFATTLWGSQQQLQVSGPLLAVLPRL